MIPSFPTEGFFGLWVVTSMVTSVSLCAGVGAVCAVCAVCSSVRRVPRCAC